MKYHELDCKSIITKSKLPDTDYVVNPYVGCSFSCLYCYASFMGRFVGESIENWGNYVYIKKNSVEIFEKQLKKLLDKKLKSTIFFSSVTDPYLPIEKKYQLTRKMLEVLKNNHYLGLVSILTKSALVLRDIDVLQELKEVEVGFTITSAKDSISKALEIKAPSITSRLHALSELNSQNIRTYAFIGPLLPHLVQNPLELESLISLVAQTGTKSVYVEQMNLSSYIKQKIISSDKTLANTYLSLQKNKMQINEDFIQGLLDKYGLHLRLGNVIEHSK